MTISLKADAGGSSGAILVGGVNAVSFNANGVDKVQDGVISTAKVAANAVTAGKLSGAQTGAAPIYGVRAWGVFNGSIAGTNAALAGGNINPIVRNSAGNYVVVFTTPMPTANYAISISSKNNPSATLGSCIVGTPTTTGFNFILLTSTPAAADSDIVTFTVIC